jgi:hypothetical protein
VNALMTQEGLILPKPMIVGGNTIYRLGFVGTIIIGIIAAFVSWGLYGPVANVDIFASSAAQQGQTISMTLATLVGAILVGIGGSRWLTNEVDKKLLRVAAAEAAKKPENKDLSIRLAMSSPLEAAKLFQ